MADHLLLQEMTRDEARAAADALLVLPLGALEQHGPHAPVGTDFIVIEQVARQAATLAAAEVPVVVAPTLPFGCSPHHVPFGGTLSLDTTTYYQTLHGLVDSLVSSGFRRVFLLNGHGGNHELVQLVARDVALVRPVAIAAASYWTIAWEALLGIGAHERGPMPGHAGVFETSMMLALRPEGVHEPRPSRAEAGPGDPAMTRPYRAEFNGSWQRMDGYTDSPDRATAEFGRVCLDAVTGAVSRAFVEFHRHAQQTHG